jgi:hypothetical protein
MIRTNADRLVTIAVGGEVWPPVLPFGGYRTDSHGNSHVWMGMAGIVYNARVGDPAYGWTADHIEPCVSMRNRNDGAEFALHYLANVGNDATVMSGGAKGAHGVVTGEHAHLLVDFEPGALEEMTVGDKIQIKAVGTGLELLDYPHVTVRKCDPRLIERMGIEELGGGRIRVKVTGVIPARMMGSGAELGADYVDQDLMSNDREHLAAIGLDRLRVGDIVAIRDHEHAFNRGYKKGAVVIGLINHGDSFMIGHGPGVMTLLSCASPMIETVIDENANIANYLGIGAVTR